MSVYTGCTVVRMWSVECQCSCGCQRAAAGTVCVPCQCDDHRRLSIVCSACQGHGKVPVKRAGAWFIPEHCATCDGSGRLPFPA